jgi:hypothetical protein
MKPDRMEELFRAGQWCLEYNSGKICPYLEKLLSERDTDMPDLPAGYIYCVQCHAYRQFEDRRCVECDSYPPDTRVAMKPPGVARAERQAMARDKEPTFLPRALPPGPTAQPAAPSPIATPSTMPRLSSPEKNLADVCGALEQEKKDLLVENAELRRKLEKTQQQKKS